VNPPREWFAVDLCNNIKSSDVTAQDFTARMRRLVADGKLDSQLLLRYSEQFGTTSPLPLPFQTILMPKR
jgi:hypothetical protein